MTPKQRYLFDLTGYIHLKNVLSDKELHGFSLHSFSKTTGDPGIRFYLK